MFLNGSNCQDRDPLDGQEIAFARLHPLLDSLVEFVGDERQRLVPFVQVGVVTLVQQGQRQSRFANHLFGVGGGDGDGRGDLRGRQSFGVHHLKEHAIINVHQVIYDVVVP